MFATFFRRSAIVSSRFYLHSHCQVRYCKYFFKTGKAKRGAPAPQPIKFSKKSNRPIVKVWQNMTIRELSRAFECDPDYIFHMLLQTEYADVFEDYDDQINHVDLIARLVNAAGYRPEFVTSLKIDEVIEEDKDVYRRPPPDPAQCQPRPPVVTIMGHVDHGKTTLLDSLRHSQIVAQEFGGITQHIGAFVVKLPHTGAKITFLDTPGHAAFKSMRARGARVTDIVVLIVAADDGVMEQTLESIRFAREAGVVMVVAINKCDKHNADVKKSKADLLAQGIHLEEYGGDVQAVCISALQGTNLVALQEAIVTQAELMNLKADYKGLVEGAVIEAKTVHGKGGVCTVLVQRGTLKKGSFLVAGEAWCRVRALYDEFGKPVTEAPPSTPVEVTGWKEDLPSAGDEILEVDSERRAKEVVAWRKKKAMEAKVEAEQPALERKRAEEREKYESERQARLALGYIKNNPNLPLPQSTKEDLGAATPRFNVIIKGDVDGSVEAILEVYETYNSPKCEFDVVTFGVGPLSEKDLEMAEITKAKIYCFNVKNSPAIEKKALEQNVVIRHFNVIYKLVDDWKNELSNLLPLVDKIEVLGEGVVLKDFLIGEKGKKMKTPVAGCRVTRGFLSKKQRIRVVRDDKVVYDGTVESMRKEKIVTDSASRDEEVGIVVEDKTVTFRPGDTVQSYELFKVPQRIDWAPPGF